MADRRGSGKGQEREGYRNAGQDGRGAGYKPSGKGSYKPAERSARSEWDKPSSKGSRRDEYRASPQPGRAKYAPGSGRPVGYSEQNDVSHDLDGYKGRTWADENQSDLDKLEGRNPVLEALKSGRSINRILVARGDKEGSINQIVAMAIQKGILVQEIDRNKMDIMSVTHAHQGVIALTAAKDYVEVEDILDAAAKSGRPPFIIILDEITDPYNFGSLLRTANAAGVHGIIISKRRAVGLTAAVSKASAGAIEYVPVARVTNIAQTIETLKKQNIWVVGTDSTGEDSYFEKDLTGPIALVIGSEGEGMGRLVKESCDFVVKIPMSGEISSLNAAVAGAIVTYEVVRQRGEK